MIGIKIKETFLDIYDKTTIGFELLSPLYFGDDVDVIQGSYSFPIQVPLTPRNRVALEYPDIIENDAAFLKNEPCEIWSNGAPLFKGLGFVKGSSNFEASFYILIDSLSTLKALSLNELPLGTTNLGIDQTAVLASCKRTTIYPDEYNHIFFPVWNPYFYEDKSSLGFAHDTFQNPWLNASHAFNPGTVSDDYIFTPFVKLNYLLYTMFASQGFGVVNKWQITHELRRMAFNNNFSITLHGFIAPAVDYTKHVSNNKCSQFLR